MTQLGAPVTVYLAGGMKTNWQDIVKARFPYPIFFDPRQHGLTEERHYTGWDLTAVGRADIVFAYLEADNPSGFGMMVEIGFGAALGKDIIFVNEKEEMDKYCGMARVLSAGHYSSFSEGLDALEHLLMQYAPENLNPEELIGVASH